MKVTLDLNIGTTVPDNKVISFVAEAISREEDVIIGSIIIFDAFRLALKNKVIAKENITFCMVTEDYTVEVLDDPKDFYTYHAEEDIIMKIAQGLL